MSSRKAFLLAAAALLALAGVGAAALLATSGDDSSAALPGLSVATPPEQKPADTTAIAPTETEAPATPTEPDAVPDQTQPAPAPAPSKPGDTRKTSFPRERGKTQNDPPQRDFAIPPAREFSGNGNAILGNVDLRQSAVVRWRTNGRFELRFGREDFPIIAPSASGQLIVPPYNFKRVRVVAQGRWKITITPQK